jgi:hypothetical protein
MTETTQGLDALFAGKDAIVRAIYTRLLDVVQTFGPFREEPKKISIHLVNTSGFAGIHPRKSFLYLNVRMDRPLQSERVAKSEQVSKNRYHNEFKIITPEEVDDELIGWLKEGYWLA